MLAIKLINYLNDLIGRAIVPLIGVATVEKV